MLDLGGLLSIFLEEIEYLLVTIFEKILSITMIEKLLNNFIENIIQTLEQEMFKQMQGKYIDFFIL